MVFRFVVISAIMLFVFGVLGPVLFKALRTGSIRVSKDRVATKGESPGRFWFAVLFLLAGFAWVGFRWIQMASRLLQ